FTTGMVLQLVHRLGFADDLAAGTSVSTLIARKNYSPRAAVPLDWFFRKLAAERLLSAESSEQETIFRARGPLPPGDQERAGSRARSIDARSMPPFTVVRTMVESVPEFLSGQKTGEEILFSPARLSLWFDYFSNENLLYQINNRLGAEAVWRALPAS